MVATPKKKTKGQIEHEEYLKSYRWRKVIRPAALKRAGNRCQFCARRQGLHVHHNSYQNYKHEKPEDLIVLCRKCHKIFHGKGYAEQQERPPTHYPLCLITIKDDKIQFLPAEVPIQKQDDFKKISNSWDLLLWDLNRSRIRMFNIFHDNLSAGKLENEYKGMIIVGFYHRGSLSIRAAQSLLSPKKYFYTISGLVKEKTGKNLAIAFT